LGGRGRRGAGGRTKKLESTKRFSKAIWWLVCFAVTQIPHLDGPQAENVGGIIVISGEKRRRSESADGGICGWRALRTLSFKQSKKTWCPVVGSEKNSRMMIQE